MARRKLEEKTIGKNVKFCDYNCEFASSSSNVPSCMTENPIYCNKYNAEVRKASLCMEIKNGR